jgi:hypothetical protein
MDKFQQTGYCIKHNRDMYFNILDNEFVCDKCQEEIWYE